MKPSDTDKNTVDSDELLMDLSEPSKTNEAEADEVMVSPKVTDPSIKAGTPSHGSPDPLESQPTEMPHGGGAEHQDEVQITQKPIESNPVSGSCDSKATEI